jgi:hypothetical protein
MSVKNAALTYLLDKFILNAEHVLYISRVPKMLIKMPALFNNLHSRRTNRRNSRSDNQ